MRLNSFLSGSIGGMDDEKERLINPAEQILEIPRNNLELIKTIQEGEISAVYFGHLKRNGNAKSCLIKVINQRLVLLKRHSMCFSKSLLDYRDDLFSILSLVSPMQID